MIHHGRIEMNHIAAQSLTWGPNGQASSAEHAPAARGFSVQDDRHGDLHLRCAVPGMLQGRIL